MAKAKHSLARKSDLKSGKTIWIVGLRGIRKKTIKNSRVNKYGTYKTVYTDGSYDCHADNAVIGLAYDNRPCQVFTNAKAAKWWHEYWKKAGIENPNFVLKNPNNNQTAGMCYPEHTDYYSSGMWY